MGKISENKAVDPRRHGGPAAAQRFARTHHLCGLAPKQRISETEIAVAYDVSRQPVREAFIKPAERNISARQFPRADLVVQNAAIVDAIHTHNADLTDAAMRSVFREFKKEPPKIIAMKPDYFEGIEVLE